MKFLIYNWCIDSSTESSITLSVRYNTPSPPAGERRGRASPYNQVMSWHDKMICGKLTLKSSGLISGGGPETVDEGRSTSAGLIRAAFSRFEVG